jgi:chromosome segregation ATPase
VKQEAAAADGRASEHQESIAGKERELAELREELTTTNQVLAEVRTEVGAQTERAVSALRRIDALEAELAHRVGELGGARYDLARAQDLEKQLRGEFAAREAEWRAQAHRFGSDVAAAYARAEEQQRRGVAATRNSRN